MPLPFLEAWVDGGSRGNPGPAAIGVVLKHGDAVHTHSELIGDGPRTNNQAEYLALIHALTWAYRNCYGRVKIHSDSKLVVNQMNGEWSVNNVQLRELMECATNLLGYFEECQIVWVPRSQNSVADALVNDAFARASA